jgi:ribosomal-protein-alanine N-acetyltransferase
MFIASFKLFKSYIINILSFFQLSFIFSKKRNLEKFFIESECNLLANKLHSDIGENSKETLMVKIETSRLKLIPCTKESIQIIDIQNYDNGPEVQNHLKELEKDPTLLTWGSWLVIRKSDDLIIGDVGFKGKPNSKKEVEVGYGLLNQYWNMGYATEAVEGLVQWAFRTGEVNKVKAETELSNTGSIRVLEKANMKKMKETRSMIYWETE